MKKLCRLFLAFLLLSASAVPVRADFQAGKEAYILMDYQKALKELLPLANQGHAQAQYYMGLMYDCSPGFPQDYKKAANWYRKAAEQGYAEAQHKMGGVYSLGMGVPESFVQAAMWYALAAGQGHEWAKKQGDALHDVMTPQQIAEARRLAGEWKPKKTK